LQQKLSDRKELRKFVVGSVLDVGIKDGYFWGGQFSVPDYVVGLDLDVWKYKNFVQGDARCLPFRDKSFHTIVCTEVLEHIEPKFRMQVLKELKRVAKKVIIISTICDDPRNYDSNPDYHYNEKQPMCRKVLIDQKSCEHKKEWIVDKQEVLNFFPKYIYFDIENPFYLGWGVVVENSSN
jgi:SAM-dependent methyltransferase